jgi:hypothetical protein
VSAVLRLKIEEPVSLDRDQLEVLYDSLGPVGADMVVNHALEELAATLARAGKQYRDGRMDDLRGSLRTLVQVARQVGMTVLARVARDVLELSDTYDAAAFGATMSRLERIGEASLIAAWDLQDVTI